MRLNILLIANFLGWLISLNGMFMLTCLPFAIYFNEPLDHLMISAAITFSAGLPLWLIKGKESRDLSKRDGYVVVTFGWLVMVLSGTLPYIICGAIPDFTNAFFETMSGYTTTGSSILNDIESLPKSILIWRSLTQWIGGMGIIVLAIAILPVLGIGGMQLFVAESPGIVMDKLKPRIKDVAKRLWMIYIGFTVLETILLQIGGMSFFDALNHALTTMSSGGFSVKQASIAYYPSPFIQYVIIVFMLVAGSNFALTYFFLKAEFRKMFNNEEFRFYISAIFGFTLIGFLALSQLVESNCETIFRETLFQVVSVITTTGFITADYTSWSPFLTLMFFALMFMGASTGSTAGGVKIIRHLILIKNSIVSMNRLLHRNGIIPVRINNRAVHPEIISGIYGFIMIYLMTFVAGVLILSGSGIDFSTSLGAVASCLGNIGPGLGDVGPAFNYYDLTITTKWVLSLLMLLGRLELFTVLILCTKYFWGKN